MTDFIHRRFLAVSRIETIWGIEDDPVFRTDVPVCMDNPGRDYNHSGRVRPRKDDLPDAARR